MAKILTFIADMSSIQESVFAEVCVIVKVLVIEVAVHVRLAPVMHCEFGLLEVAKLVEEGPLSVGLLEIVAIITKLPHTLVRLALLVAQPKMN
jgi:hypothetical protein